MFIDFRQRGGKEAVVEALTVIQNGTYTPKEGIDGFSPVDVNVPIPTFETEELKATENKVYTPTKDGFSKVTVNVPIPVPVEKKMQEKTIPEITTNGSQSITPDAGFDGISKLDFTVNVPSSTGKMVFQDGTKFAYSTWSSFPYGDESLANIKDGSHLFENNASLTTIPSKLSNCTDTSYMFKDCKALTSVDFIIGKSNNYEGMFAGCTNLTSLYLNASFGKIAPDCNCANMFQGITTTGKLKLYTERHVVERDNYQPIIAVLPSTWTVEEWENGTDPNEDPWGGGGDPWGGGF